MQKDYRPSTISVVCCQVFNPLLSIFQVFTNTLSRYENIVYFSQADFVRPARRRANTGQRNQRSSRNTGTDGDQNGSAAERLSEMQECAGENVAVEVRHPV